MLDTLVSFGFLHGDDIERAIEWLDTPPEWRRGMPPVGARKVLRIIEELGGGAG